MWMKLYLSIKYRYENNNIICHIRFIHTHSIWINIISVQDVVIEKAHFECSAYQSKQNPIIWKRKANVMEKYERRKHSTIYTDEKAIIHFSIDKNVNKAFASDSVLCSYLYRFKWHAYGEREKKTTTTFHQKRFTNKKKSVSPAKWSHSIFVCCGCGGGSLFCLT